MALVNGATSTEWTYRNPCKFFSESDKKKRNGFGLLKNSGEQFRAILALLLFYYLGVLIRSIFT